MTRGAAAIAFLESREGFGWIVILTFAALLAVIAGCGFHKVSLDAYVANKTDEKGTALELVDAFVSNYSNLRLQLGADAAPVPATFRAHSIDLFNKTRGVSNALRLRWIGRAGRAIATPPSDPKMAVTIESFVGRSDPSPVSQFVTVDGEQMFRTVYPSIARERSCVDCHNKLQPGKNWQLNDVMGAFSIDVPVTEFLYGLRWESTCIAAIVFFLIGGIGLWMSLSHYRRIVEREAAREQAEAANQAKSSFLANASHELRTPLNSIVGCSDIMMSEALGAFPNEKYRAYVADIHNNGSHLLEVINDIVDLSKAEGGNLDLDDDLFDPRDMIGSIGQVMGDRLRAVGVTLTAALPNELPLLRGDRRRAKQVLLNLIDNALHVRPLGRAIELTCRADHTSGLAITLTATRSDAAAEDSGLMARPAGSSDRQSHHAEQGSRFGLPLVKAIMELHGGTFELNSPAEAGISATVTFPAERLVFDATRSAA